MFSFDNSYKKLPKEFFSEQKPEQVADPNLVIFNKDLGSNFGLSQEFIEEEKDLAQYFSGNKLLTGSEPIAQAYAGHQFGQANPQLGDGRAILLGEILTQDNKRFDLQVKGSGRTPYSRNGDGKAWLGPVLREYLVSEAMYKLGIPTTRALCAVTTGENIYRERELPGAILTRIASSHIRVGTFEYFFFRKDLESTKILADYTIQRHYPHCEGDYLAFFKEVCKKQAQLITKWLSIGFIHGVMNTDNTSISGETIDYGPCAFMDFYDPQTVFSSIDHGGRYAYGQQPAIAHWNLTCLANCLLELIDQDEETAINLCSDALNEFSKNFNEDYEKTFLAKVGLTKINDNDFDLVKEFQQIMFENKADFTLSYRFLADQIEAKTEEFYKLFDNTMQLDTWLEKWQERLKQEKIELKQIQKNMNAINPIFIPRNHNVEAMITQASEDKDFSLLNALLQAAAKPYESQEQYQEFYKEPQVKDGSYVTFCGT